MAELTLEQKIVKYLANIKFLTNVGDVSMAMKDPEYAKLLITGDGLSDEIQDSGEYDCDHEALSNDEIQVVFDNDEKNNK